MSLLRNVNGSKMIGAEGGTSFLAGFVALRGKLAA